jgi:hypothetical protein
MTPALPERSSLTVAILGAVVVSLSYCALLLDKETVKWAAAEDRPFEYGGAICFALTGFMLLWLFFKSRPGNNFFAFQTTRNVFFALLAAAFLFAAGEEVSWGQRLLKFQVPDIVLEENLQNEFNIHNLKIFHPRDADGNFKSGLNGWLTIERLFSLFWLGFCVITPLAYHYIAPLRRLISALNLPVAGLAIGLLFPLNYAISKILESILTGEAEALGWPMIEIKESTFAFLFMLVAWDFVARHRAASQEA